MPATECNKIPLSQLGKDGPRVPCLELGCMGMSEFYGESNEKDNLEVLNHALDLGCSFWDTVDMYGCGDNERLLAKVLKERRNEIFLCTKFAMVRDTKYGPEWTVRGDKEYVKLACQDSLDRLGIDSIDLLYQARKDPNTSIEETVEAMAELKKEGKIKYLGLSECSAETLRRAYKVHPISAVEVEYSPWETSIETNGLLDACRELGVAIVAYSPLGRGFLTGAIKKPEDFPKGDLRVTRFPRFYPENFYKNLELVKKLEEVASKKGVQPSQLCLSWVLSKGEDFITIPGTKRIKYLEQNIESVFINITEEENNQIEEIISTIPVSGDRYSSRFIKDLDS